MSGPFRVSVGAGVPLHHATSGDEVIDEPVAPGIQVGVADPADRARRVDDPPVSRVDRDVRNRLARLGEEHEVTRPQRAKIGRYTGACAGLLARGPGQSNSVLRDYAFREAGAVEPLARRTAAPDVLHAAIGLGGTKHAGRLRRWRRRIRNASPRGA